MVIFEFDMDQGDTREVTWLGSTLVTGVDKKEADNIYEQLCAHEAFLDE